jgi:hypothetical protein
MTNLITRNQEKLFKSIFSANESLWLIGSRASKTFHVKSDWDFLVFGNNETIKRLEIFQPLNRIDLLVVYDGNNFRTVWLPPDGKGHKSGSLTDWLWQNSEMNETKYYSSKHRAFVPALKISSYELLISLFNNEI